MLWQLLGFFPEGVSRTRWMEKDGDDEDEFQRLRGTEQSEGENRTKANTRKIPRTHRLSSPNARRRRASGYVDLYEGEAQATQAKKKRQRTLDD